MPGRKKKSVPKNKQQAAPAKYSIPPLTPVKTRSASVRPASPAREVGGHDLQAKSPDFSSEISSLESKFDARMAQMETSFRASITSALSASSSIASSRPEPVPVPLDLPVVAPPPPPTAPAQVAAAPVVAKSSRPSRASSTSSAASGRGLSSSDSSASRSRSRRPRDHRSRDRGRASHRSPRRSSRKTSRNKHGKYTTLRYVPEHKVITSYERLILANLRMILRFYKKDRDIKGMLKHSILLAEKADADVFHNDALISYDESIKTAAGEDGIGAFSKLDPAAIIKHLSYDGTKAARAARSRQPTKSSTAPTRSSGNTTSACFKFNFASGGCRRTKCSYPHVCSACSGPGHVNADCPNVDRAGDKSSRK